MDGEMNDGWRDEGIKGQGDGWSHGWQKRGRDEEDEWTEGWMERWMMDGGTRG